MTYKWAGDRPHGFVCHPTDEFNAVVNGPLRCVTRPGSTPSCISKIEFSVPSVLTRRNAASTLVHSRRPILRWHRICVHCFQYHRAITFVSTLRHGPLVWSDFPNGNGGLFCPSCSMSRYEGGIEKWSCTEIYCCWPTVPFAGVLIFVGCRVQEGVGQSTFKNLHLFCI